MSALNIIPATIPAAPRSEAPANADAGTGFGALVDAATTSDAADAARRGQDPEVDREVTATDTPPGLLTGAGQVVPIADTVAQPARVDASTLTSQTPGTAAFADPGSINDNLLAAQGPAQSFQPVATVAPQPAPVPPQPGTPATTEPGTAPAAAQAALGTAQKVAEALAQGGLTATPPAGLPEAELGTTRLKALLQDGEKRSDLRDGAKSAQPLGEGAVGVSTQTTTAVRPVASGLADRPELTTKGETASPDLTLQSEPNAPTGTSASVSVTRELESAPAVLIREATSGLSRATIETTAQIAAQIVRRLEGRSTRFEMALTPEGLGRVDVSLDIDADGQLAARLAFDNPLAALELRGRADELRRQLQEAGFQLAGDALDFSQRNPSSGEGFDRRSSRAFAGASRLNSELDAAVATPPRWLSLTLSPSGVDMKV